MLSLPSLAAASALTTQPHLAVRAPIPAPRAISSMNARWKDPILNDDSPDPVFDADIGYKGRSAFGFNDFAEKINGRAAMMGFTVLYLQEAIVGKGVLEQYGFPYDEGAVLSTNPQAGGFIWGLPIAVGIVGGLTFAGEKVLGGGGGDSSSGGGSSGGDGGGFSLPNPFGK